MRVDWVAVVTSESGDIGASAGVTPDADWLRSFAAGVIHAPRSPDDLEGIVWSPAPPGGLIVGREGPPFVGSERAELDGWAAVASALNARLERPPR